MNKTELDTLIEQLKLWGIILEPGLSDHEMNQIEQEGKFRFPPDLRWLLQRILPIEDNRGYRNFPNWRAEGGKLIEKHQEFLLDGIIFDVTQQKIPHWLESWGEMPTNMDDAVEIVKQVFSDAPRLIPVYGHRFIPSQPPLSDNPIFSIWQTDIICMGNNLVDYFYNEFGRENRSSGQFRQIPFWDDLYMANNASFIVNYHTTELAEGLKRLHSKDERVYSVIFGFNENLPIQFTSSKERLILNGIIPIIDLNLNQSQQLEALGWKRANSYYSYDWRVISKAVDYYTLATLIVDTLVKAYGFDIRYQTIEIRFG
ncbi:MAG: hypothetical protein K8L91_23505 [Anaerolineae bacterium]|nr:hypothetical protein [Anaerolineae bacterium]